MKKIVYILFFLFFSCNIIQEKIQTDDDVTKFVNPFIGTDGVGNTYPGATSPFGMIQLSPDIGVAGWDRISGYFYPDSIITGFSHTHLSGTGAGDLYDILIMPTNGRFNKRIAENNFKPFSVFSHKNESATAGYYSVHLQSFNIKAELTTTPRVGVHKYTFPKDKNSQILVDLGYHINWDRPTSTHISVIDSITLQGHRHSTGWAKNQRVFFVIKLSKPFQNYQLFSKNQLISGENNEEIDKISLHYETSEQESIVIKTAISSVSVENALNNLNSETSNFDFEEIRKKNKDLWQKELQKIQIKTNSDTEKTIFYTMLYQSMLAPNLFSDANGEYKGANDSICKTNGQRYDTFSLWDTFRAAHPLYSIINPEKNNDFIDSFLKHYEETGILPVWSMQGNETNMMIGAHAIPIIVDAYFKGAKMNEALAYEACKASMLQKNRELDLYDKYGFVPYDLDTSGENWSVSKTLEYAYDDWCVAQFAKALQKSDDYSFFIKRSENWKNIFDERTRFFRPKNSTGKFLPHFNPNEYTKYFCESNAWQYRFFVPHDIKTLKEKMGGKVAFEQKLDSMFSFYSTSDEKLPIFSTGMIGQYVHGNEPSHHITYLYNYTHSPIKTHEKVQQILQTQYKNQPNGHCGNEDCGQMSSWFVLSALGFYPVNPATPYYNLGVPAHKEAIIHLSNGKKFSIQARNLSDKNKYIKDLYLNNRPMNRLYITHKEISEGGSLIFDMTNEPHNERLEKYDAYHKM